MGAATLVTRVLNWLYLNQSQRNQWNKLTFFHADDTDSGKLKVTQLLAGYGQKGSWPFRSWKSEICYISRMIWGHSIITSEFYSYCKIAVRDHVRVPKFWRA